jgi:hypothetical protein
MPAKAPALSVLSVPLSRVVPCCFQGVFGTVKMGERHILIRYMCYEKINRLFQSQRNTLKMGPHNLAESPESRWAGMKTGGKNFGNDGVTFTKR